MRRIALLHPGAPRRGARTGILILLTLWLGFSVAAQAQPRFLTTSKLGYVPAAPTGKGSWISRKIQAVRVRRSQRLLEKLESSPQVGRRSLGNLFGLIKRGHYHNLVLGGTTGDGAPVTIVAGKHRRFPFVSQAGNWDNVQVKVGDRSYAINRADLPRLSITFEGKGETRRIQLAYDGPLAEQQSGSHAMADFHRTRLPSPANKGTTAASLRLELDARSLGMLPMGLAGVVGMEYFPRKVEGTGTLSIGGRRVALRKVGGEMETGRMSNLSAHRAVTAVYDYQGLTTADGTGHVSFTGRGAGSGKTSKLARVTDRVFDGIARVAGTRQFGLDAQGIRHDQPLSPAEGRIVAYDVVQFPNGVALERRVVEARDAQGKAYRGLQERFFK